MPHYHIMFHRCFRKFRPQVSVQHALGELKCVEALLRDMMKKYEKECRGCLEEFRQTKEKRRKILILKKKKTIELHIKQCESRITSCIQRQYSLEQLELTRMQIKAVETTSKVFRKFTKYQSLQKVEDMQDNMEELMEKLTDMGDLLATPIIQLTIEDYEDIDAEFETLEDHGSIELPEAPNTTIAIGVAKDIETGHEAQPVF